MLQPVRLCALSSEMLRLPISTSRHRRRSHCAAHSLQQGGCPHTWMTSASRSLAYAVSAANHWTTLQHCRSHQQSSRSLTIQLYCVSNNAPNLASCSFDKHELILINFSNKHQHTFGNDVPTELSISCHFCLLYLLLNQNYSLPNLAHFL